MRVEHQGSFGLFQVDIGFEILKSYFFRRKTYQVLIKKSFKKVIFYTFESDFDDLLNAYCGKESTYNPQEALSKPLKILPTIISYK